MGQMENKLQRETLVFLSVRENEEQKAIFICNLSKAFRLQRL